MNKIAEAALYIQSLNKKEFKQYLLITLGIVSFICVGVTFYIYHTSSTLIQQLKTLNQQTNQVSEIIAKSKQLAQQEEKIKEKLNNNPGFDMNIYFEQFLSKHNIKAEPNFKPEEGDELEGSDGTTKYQEIILKAMFKDQTMEKLVTIIHDIYKEEIIYLKALDIMAEGKKINFEITLATKIYKKEQETE